MYLLSTVSGQSKLKYKAVKIIYSSPSLRLDVAFP